MPSFRHLSRIVAMQTLFECTLRRDRDLRKTLEYNQNVFAKKVKDTAFLRKLVFGVIENRKEIDTKINQYAPEWPIEKLPMVERVILEIGLYEFLYMQDTPRAVVINEAVEISKIYGDENSNKFINGVLSTANKNIKQK